MKKSISITLDPEVIEKIEALASYQDRSLSSYINMVLKKHLAQVEKNPES